MAEPVKIRAGAGLPVAVPGTLNADGSRTLTSLGEDRGIIPEGFPKRGEPIGGLQFRTFLLDRSAFNEQGEFEGLASAFDVVDSYGTKWEAGAWTAGGLTPDQVFALLWMHDCYEPVGQFKAEERSDGLWIKGGYDPTEEGQRARARAMSGSAPELSVGFWANSTELDEGVEVFTSTTLVEVSQITRNFAAQPGAGLTDVRSIARHAQTKAAEEAEQRLRRARAAAARLSLASLGK